MEESMQANQPGTTLQSKQENWQGSREEFMKKNEARTS